MIARFIPSRLTSHATFVWLARRLHGALFRREPCPMPCPMSDGRGFALVDDTP